MNIGKPYEGEDIALLKAQITASGWKVKINNKEEFLLR